MKTQLVQILHILLSKGKPIKAILEMDRKSICCIYQEPYLGDFKYSGTEKISFAVFVISFDVIIQII